MNNSNYKIEELNMQLTEEWNDFVAKSKNATFLHNTNYMHYHIDRFNDCSLIIKKNEQIVALLPGNISENTVFYSHQGLTYGGLLITNDTKLPDVLEYFNIINRYLYDNKKVTKIVYKTIPYIYSNVPSQEDEYALFRLGAKRIACSASSTIIINNKIKISSLRKRKIKKSQSNQLNIQIDNEYEEFWNILKNNLEDRHGTKPVHSVEELKLLKKRFPNEIKLFSVYFNNECLAGALIYIVGKVAHVQYIASNDIGKQVSALDYLFNYLIEDVFNDMNYFDFGTSVEENGYKLNEGLIFQKEGFGARTVVYNHYEYYLEEVLK
ncbi:GNAT family N-acetyltransferase [Lysinibacillus sp. B2A1]|nr:GNAT family N-acetyltransferase [Lysinibacillus sp. B2A1]